MSKGDRELIRAVQGQINETRFGPGMKQNPDGTWSPYLDPQGPQRFGKDGRIETLVAGDLTVATGSPRAIHYRSKKLRMESMPGLIQRLTSQDDEIANNAAQIDVKADAAALADLETIVNGKAASSHGSNHTSAGSDPIPMATTAAAGIVKQAVAVTDPANGTTSVSKVDATIIPTLVNLVTGSGLEFETRVKLNALIDAYTDLADKYVLLHTSHVNLLASLRTAGVLST